MTLNTRLRRLRQRTTAWIPGSSSSSSNGTSTPGPRTGAVNNRHHRLPGAGVTTDHVPHQVEEVLKLPNVMLFELLLPSQHPGHKLRINTQILRDAPRPQIPAEHPEALHWIAIHFHHGSPVQTYQITGPYPDHPDILKRPESHIALTRKKPIRANVGKIRPQAAKRT